MASTETALFSLLTTGSPNAVAAIISTRAHPEALPQGISYPAIRYQRISTARSPYRTLDGKAEYAAVRMQVDCYALTAFAAISLAQAVYRLVEGFTGTIGGLRIDVASTDDQRADLEDGAGPGGSDLYRQSLDVILWHPE